MYAVSPLDANAKILKDNNLAKLILKAFVKKMTELTSEIIDELSSLAE